MGFLGQGSRWTPFPKQGRHNDYKASHALCVCISGAAVQFTYTIIVYWAINEYRPIALFGRATYIGTLRMLRTQICKQSLGSSLCVTELSYIHVCSC